MIKKKTETAKLTIVIPTLNAGADLASTLDALSPGTPFFRVLVVDGGSADDTGDIASSSGAMVIEAPTGRGSQLMAGANAAATDWLLFLHADTRLEAGWLEVAEAFIGHPANAEKAGYFRFGLDGPRTWYKDWIERGVAARCKAIGLPFGDQGLLIRDDFYRSVGGYRPFPLFEDVDLVRAIGKNRLSLLPVVAETSAVRYERDGYISRIARNLCLQALYRLGTPPEKLARFR